MTSRLGGRANGHSRSGCHSDRSWRHAVQNSGIEGGTAALSVRAAFADRYRIAPSSAFERGSFEAWTNGHGECPLNWHDVVIMTTAGCMGLSSNPLPAVMSCPEK